MSEKIRSRRRGQAGGIVILASVICCAAMSGVQSCEPALETGTFPVKSISAERPNIVFAIADDWSWPHAGAYGDKVVKTPTFDRVAREGVLFTNSFCASPSCTPSRGAILTGQAVHRLEEGANLWSFLPKKFAVYPDILEQATDECDECCRLRGGKEQVGRRVAWLDEPNRRPTCGGERRSVRSLSVLWPRADCEAEMSVRRSCLS